MHIENKLFILAAVVVLSGVLTSSAFACNCGKKDSQGNVLSSCRSQCGESCGEQSACSEHPMLLAQNTEILTDEKKAVRSVEAGNKVCPVSGKKVGEMGEGVTYEYNGKTYNLCCVACIRSFEKNPEKYSKIAEKEIRKTQKKIQKEQEREHHEILRTHQRHHAY